MKTRLSKLTSLFLGHSLNCNLHTYIHTYIFYFIWCLIHRTSTLFQINSTLSEEGGGGGGGTVEGSVARLHKKGL